MNSWFRIIVYTVLVLLSKAQINAVTKPSPKQPNVVYFNTIDSFYENLDKMWLHQTLNMDPASLAIHRAMGSNYSTLLHFELISEGVKSSYPSYSPHEAFHVLDAGCGMGAGLAWNSIHNPNWNLLGLTLSSRQYSFISQNLTKRYNFSVTLQSYDKLTMQYHAIYSVEALVHSPNLTYTMKVWASHLHPGGVVALIDDYLLSPGIINQLRWAAADAGLVVREFRDLNQVYNINKYQYKGFSKGYDVSHHYGWINNQHMARVGSIARRWLMINHMITYGFFVLQKL